jgi:hypothetical protein
VTGDDVARRIKDVFAGSIPLASRGSDGTIPGSGAGGVWCNLDGPLPSENQQQAFAREEVWQNLV